MIKSNSMGKGFKGYRWVICLLLFLATTTNYLDRQLLSMLSPELKELFSWSNQDYALILMAFTIFYGLFMAIAGPFIDRLGTKKGLFWAFVIWNVASAAHALAPEIGIAINPLVSLFGLTMSTSVIGFMFMRAILGIGEASMFPAAIKATAEWFPKKERSLCTGLFNSGTNVGAIIAPLIVTFVALQFGWRWAFVILGGITLIWLIFWQIYYDSPFNMLKKGKITQEEYDYIHADDETDVAVEATDKNKVAWHKILKHPQTWAFAFGKFLTDGIWWFFLFWLPLYLSQAHGQSPAQIAIYVAAVFTMATFGSIFGGYLPSRLMKSGKDPYKARMLAMFIIALFPLVVLGAQPLGAIHVLFPVILIGIGASAHQAWSANLFTTVSDMFPKKAVGSVVGFGGMMGATGSFLIHLVSGKLFDYHAALGQIEVGYGIMFIVCALAYLVAWVIMKVLVPKYKVIKEI